MLFSRRSFIGSSVSEMGPALFILLLVVLFPMLDLLYLGLGYAASWYLNHLEIRELAIRSPAQSSAALKEVDNLWANSGFGHLVGATVSSITHSGPAYDPDTSVPPDPLGFVKITTTVTIEPFLKQAPVGLNSVPGLGKAVTFSFSDRRPQEEKGRD
jgi:hypothetical protein